MLPEKHYPCAKNFASRRPIMSDFCVMFGRDFSLGKALLIFYFTNGCGCKGWRVKNSLLGNVARWGKNRIKNVEKSSLRVQIIEYFIYFCVKFAWYALLHSDCWRGRRVNDFFV